ncbi:hypothetical protein VIGAN_02244900 [Vigna angularis var. angularis]|uniref:Uncharacterized protein n=1 Tax=Vigna angularis var. angularis TaxID=157739 RepID=A0A0S3RGE4_PHAAN|nr:hypothetical protein VIGAN_02244900 [Vigna angularis var. angularis]
MFPHKGSFKGVRVESTSLFWSSRWRLFHRVVFRARSSTLHEINGWELLYVGCNLLQALLLCASIERRGSRWTESAGPCWTRGGLLDAAACWTNTGRR